jgi:hypothetical protein
MASQSELPQEEPDVLAASSCSIDIDDTCAAPRSTNTDGTCTISLLLGDGARKELVACS